MQIPLKRLKPYAILLLALFIAYLPVSSFYFGMKNDAFSDNFPGKFFLSQALHSGNLPLWNPYMNFGFPAYADPGFAFYNPITWFFALIGYNAYTLTAEVLLYIYIGGFFMYRLARYLHFSMAICLAAAIMYMCCGFYAGCLTFINFLTAAAFLPFVVQGLMQLLAAPCVKNSFLLAGAGYFVFAGGHPYMPVMLVYFIAVFLSATLLFNKPQTDNIKKTALYLAVALAFFLLLCLPAFYSYLTVMPVYGRNYPAPQQLNTGQGFTLSSYLSFIFPFSTGVSSNIFNADVTMRNGYFGITGLACALLSIKTKNTHVKVFLIAGLCMLVLSLGGPLKAALYSRLPLLVYICHNGEYRIFSILCCIMAGCYGLQLLQKGDAAFTRSIKLLLYVVLAACLCTVAVVLACCHNVVSSSMAVLHTNVPSAQKIKTLLAGPFPLFLLASAAVTTVVCLMNLYALRPTKNSFTALLAVIFADLCINTSLYLPVTGIGQAPLKTIQSIYNTSPKGIPIPRLVAVAAIDTLDAKTTGLVGDITYYNKLIGTTKLTDYPSYFTATGKYFDNPPLVAAVSKHPYLFLMSSGLSTGIAVQKFTPQKIELTVLAPQADTLVYLQNNYQFWHAEVNGKPVHITTAYGTFMSVKLDKGVNRVVFYYRDVWLGVCITTSISFAVCGIFFISGLLINNQRRIRKNISYILQASRGIQH